MARESASVEPRASPEGAAVCPLLTPLEEAAWFGMLHAHTVLTKAIDAELVRVHQLPLMAFEVLMHAARCGAVGLGMSDLARRVLLSPSGLSRLVDRLEHEGLLGRQGSDNDGRAVRVCVTPAGRQRLNEAARTHVAVVRERFLQGLAEAELEQLAALWQRVAGGACDAGPAQG